MTHHAVGELTLHDLTLEERAALERAVDGPITSVMIADMVRGPRAVFPPAINKRFIAWIAADLAFYRNRIMTLESEITAVMADRDQMYSDVEQDRKTRHIAALRCQRDGLLAHCRPYEALLCAARGQLGAEAPENAAVICTPSASRADLSGD